MRTTARAVATAAVLGGVACWVLSVVRPWGDTGVTPAGGLRTSVPAGAVVLTGLGLLAAIAGLTVRGRRAGTGAAGVATVLGAVGLAVTAPVLAAQELPRDGGWFGLLAAAAGVAAGLLALGARAPRRSTSAPVRARVQAVAVTAGLVVAAVGVWGTWAVAAGWPAHRLAAAYAAGPALVREAGIPVTLRRVGWTREVTGRGQVAGVFDGRVVLASPAGPGPGGCALTVTALDPVDAHPVWTVRRPVRCGAAGAVSGLDGDDQVVRVRLGTRPAQVDLYLDPASGRETFPGAAVALVTRWTQGFGLVLPDAATGGVTAVVPRTGAIAWSRPAPHCPAGPAGTPAAVLGRPAVGAVASPFDGQDPSGALPVVQAGVGVVLGYTCGSGATLTRHVWLVDPAGDGRTDRDVTLPAAGAGPAGGPVAPTSFAAAADTVVAVTGPDPTGTDPTGTGPTRTGPTRTGLTGIDAASGAVLWHRTGSVAVRSVGLDAAGRLVLGLAAPGRGAGAADAVLLDRRTGAEVGRWTSPDDLAGSVSLAGGVVTLGASAAGGTVTVADPGTGAALGRVPVPACAARPAPTFQLLPGAVLLRCRPPGAGSGTRLVGLLP